MISDEKDLAAVAEEAGNLLQEIQDEAGCLCWMFLTMLSR